jgi:CHAD domain-containing protein
MRRSATKNPGVRQRLTGKTSAGEAFRRCIATSEAALRRLDPEGGARDVVTVHHLRTAIRRLRSLLAAFKDLLPPGERKALSERLKDISRRYAAVREWDVLIEALTKDADAGERRKLADVAAAARRWREAMTLRDHLAPRDDIRAVEHAIRSAPWLQAPSPGETEAWNRPVGDFAAALFDHQRRRMRKGSRRLDLANPASFHKFRIAAKKHRYAIEFLQPLYGKKSTKDYLASLVAIQDVLGDLRDALTARDLIAKLRLPPASRLLAAHWLERRAAGCRKRVPASEAAFRRETPFWEH